MELSKRVQEIVDAPLYEEFDLAGITDHEFGSFVFQIGTFDAYCRACEQNSVFGLIGRYMWDDPWSFTVEQLGKKLSDKVIITMRARCSRSGCGGSLYFCFYRDHENKKMTKIGQYPSKASLDLDGLDPIFTKELEPEFRRELGRAIGLRGHGIGIGSFVYLRRIFEKLIEEAHIAARLESGWDESAYAKARILDRIKMLKARLPNRLVESAKLYGVLSKGVHELSEEECLSHFDIVQTAILMILSERHEEREYRRLVKKLDQV
jgi:hypothetical protein